MSEADPRVSDADRAVDAAHAQQNATQQRHQQQRTALRSDEAHRDQLGMRTVNPRQNVHDARTRHQVTRR